MTRLNSERNRQGGLLPSLSRFPDPFAARVKNMDASVLFIDNAYMKSAVGQVANDVRRGDLAKGLSLFKSTWPAASAVYAYVNTGAAYTINLAGFTSTPVDISIRWQIGFTAMGAGSKDLEFYFLDGAIKSMVYRMAIKDWSKLTRLIIAPVFNFTSFGAGTPWSPAYPFGGGAGLKLVVSGPYNYSISVRALDVATITPDASLQNPISFEAPIVGADSPGDIKVLSVPMSTKNLSFKDWYYFSGMMARTHDKVVSQLVDPGVGPLTINPSGFANLARLRLEAPGNTEGISGLATVAWTGFGGTGSFGPMHFEGERFVELFFPALGAGDTLGYELWSAQIGSAVATITSRIGDASKFYMLEFETVDFLNDDAARSLFPSVGSPVVVKSPAISVGTIQTQRPDVVAPPVDSLNRIMRAANALMPITGAATGVTTPASPSTGAITPVSATVYNCGLIVEVRSGYRRKTTFDVILYDNFAGLPALAGAQGPFTVVTDDQGHAKMWFPGVERSTDPDKPSITLWTRSAGRAVVVNAAANTSVVVRDFSFNMDQELFDALSADARPILDESSVLESAAFRARSVM